MVEKFKDISQKAKDNRELQKSELFSHLSKKFPNLPSLHLYKDLRTDKLVYDLSGYLLKTRAHRFIKCKVCRQSVTGKA